MKKAKKVLAMFLLILSIVSVMAVPASAAEVRSSTSTIDDFYVYAGTYSYLSPMVKETSKNIYFYYNTGSVTMAKVVASGKMTYSGSYTPLTRYNGASVTNVYCQKGIQYNIQSAIYTNGYTYASLGIMREQGSNSYIGGEWSPDSPSTSYRVATP